MALPTDTREAPRDAVAMQQLLEQMGVEDYEPRVVQQLLDFMYRYVSEVLQDAQAITDRTNPARKEMSVEDVVLAIEGKTFTSFVQPPSQDALLTFAEKRNKAELPAVKSRPGLKLPRDDQCLVAPNYQFKPLPPPQDGDLDEFPMPAAPVRDNPMPPPVVAPQQKTKQDQQQEQARTVLQDQMDNNVLAAQMTEGFAEAMGQMAPMEEF